MKEEALVSLTVNQNKLKKKILIKDDMIKKTENIQIDMLKRLKKLEKRLNETDERIYYNQSDINKLNQYSRRENIEIAGIPKNNKHENLESYVLQVINSLGIKATSYDIAACHRLNTKDNDGNKNTIVRFLCRKKVGEILSKKKNLSNNEIKEKLNNKELFIMENLSPMNRKILDTCNYLKKKNLISSCWSYNGIINIKFSRDEDEIPTKLFHFEDIFFNIDDAEKFCD